MSHMHGRRASRLQPSGAAFGGKRTGIPSVERRRSAARMLIAATML